jgi:membrane protease YdiL (CAAX protease family)
MTVWWAGPLGIAFCALLYSWNYWCRDRLSDWLVPYTGLQRRLPRRSAQLVVRIPFYGFPGIVAYAVLRPFIGDRLLPLRFSLYAVGAGLLLGAALMMAGSALANGAFTAEMATRGRRRPSEIRAELRTAKDSGWIRGYTIAYRTLPVPVFLLLTVVSVTGEELAFRGILLPLLAAGFGRVAGYWMTVAAFMGIQAMFMPTLRGALVPMSGAFVVGAVLGYLGLTGSGLVLLIASHVGFFLVTMVTLMAEPGRRRTEMAAGAAQQGRGRASGWRAQG